MDRIATMDVSKSATKKWKETIPKVTKMAVAENNPSMDIWLDKLDDYSDGM